MKKFKEKLEFCITYFSFKERKKESMKDLKNLLKN